MDSTTEPKPLPNPKHEPDATHVNDPDHDSTPNAEQTHSSNSTTLRSRYLTLTNRISEEKDDIGSLGSDKFTNIIDQVEKLHQRVNKPREQVADAEALLELTESLCACVKSHAVSGITTSEFVYGLLKEFKMVSRQNRGVAEGVIDWNALGLFVSPIFKNGKCCNTMLGPMSDVLKHRKAYARRQRTKIANRAKPKELDDAAEKITDTDKNIVVMFEILKNKKTVQLENLVLNRRSFAQTVENLFALSFLVKDGRVTIDVDDEGSHFVSPRNAPHSQRILSGEDKFDHFVFRFDFSDWKMMLDVVTEGKELMPHREEFDQSSYSQATADKTKVKTIPMNCGMLKQEQLNFTDSGETKINDAGRNSQKRKLF